MKTRPPTIVGGFSLDNNFVDGNRITPLGSDIGPVKLDDGTVVEGGKILMPDQWNSRSYGPLEAKHEPQDI